MRPSGNGPEAIRAALTAAASDTAEQLAAITRQLASVVEASADDNADDEHDPEGATIAFERAQLHFLREQAVTRGSEIDRALRRLEAGGYGTCVRCGNPISPERLIARPASATCIACASK